MKKKSLKEIAYEYIKTKILTCEYLPNTMINEGMICEAVNSSRTPVREALSKLEQENLVTIIPKKGIMVKDITLDDIKNIYETRLIIEVYAIKKYGKELDIEKLKKFKSEFNDENKSDILNQYKIDDEFHEYIVSKTKNIYLINILDTIYSNNNRVRIMSGKNLNERIDNSIKEHNAILDKLIEKNYEKAVTALRDHLERSRDIAYKSLTNINIS